MRTQILIVLAGLAAIGCDAQTTGARAGAGVPAAALDMGVTRASHGAAAIDDGRVLLIGGCVRESCEPGPDSATATLFDPATRTFTPAGALLGPRTSAVTVRLPSGEIFIAGGWSGSSVTSLVEAFDHRSGKSRRLPDLSLARSDIASVRLADGRIVLAGGYDGSSPVDLVELFDPAQGTIATLGRLKIPRAGAGAALLPGGDVLIVGGESSGQVPTAAAERLDPRTGASRLVGSLAQARYKHAVASLADGRVVAIGGSDERDRGGKIDTIEVFDPGTGRFTLLGRMLEPRFKIGSAVQALADGRLLIAGGSRAEVFDPAARKSAYVGPAFGRTLNFSTATLLPGGSVLVAGGYDEIGIRMGSWAWVIEAPAAPAGSTADSAFCTALHKASARNGLPSKGAPGAALLIDSVSL